MNKKLLPLLALLATPLVSCDTNQKGADGYVFEMKQTEDLQPRVMVVPYDSEADFLRAANDKGIKHKDVLAFAELPHYNNAFTCTIHIVDPAVKYQPEMLGHEFAHCLYGQWHPKV